MEELLPLAEKVYKKLPSQSSQLHLLNRADILSARGRTLMLKGEIQGAIIALSEAVELYRSMGESHPAHLRLALLSLAKAHEAYGQPSEAVLYLSHADEVVKESESTSPTPHRCTGGSRIYQSLHGTPLMDCAAKGTGQSPSGLLGNLFESPGVSVSLEGHLAKQSPEANLRASLDAPQGTSMLRTERLRKGMSMS